MGNFKRLLRASGYDWTAYERWMRRCEREGGQGKAALDAYQAALKRCEVAEAYLHAWMIEHIDDADYPAALAVKVKRLEALQAASVGRLERVFAHFKQDTL